MDEQKFQDILRGMVNEMVSQKTKDEAIEIAATENEKMVKMLEQNADLKARLEALEAIPAKKVQIAAIDDPTDVKTYMYKGYDLRAQGATLDIENDRKELYAKFLIDCLSKASMNEGTDSQGGYLVPEEYGNEILRFATRQSIALQECTIIPMNREVMTFPSLATSVSTTWVGEAGSITQSDPTFGQVTLTARKLAARSIASNELLADSAYDVVGLLTERFSEAIAMEIDDSVFVGGNGSTFTGAVSGATTNTVSCIATGTSPSRHIQITHDELSFAIAELTENKLNGAKWYLHPLSMHYVRVEEDGAGNPIFSAPGNGVPGTIWEYSYRVSDKIVSATPGADSPLMLFGNLKNYLLGRRKGDMTLSVNPYLLWNTDQTSFRITNRWHGQYGLEAAMVQIKTHA